MGCRHAASWLTAAVKKSLDFGLDDHPDDDEEQPRLAWAVAIRDDCDGCADLRVEVMLEEIGRSGTGLTAHLSPSTARKVRAALATALREIGEDSGS
jgi:hypothetical protein